MKKMTRILALIAALILCLSLAACGEPAAPARSGKLNLDDYLSVSYKGTDGNGTATLHFDFAQMELDFAGVKDGIPSKEALEKMVSLYPFELSIRCELNNSKELRNGDMITATITFNSDLAKEANINIGSTTRFFIVEGLR